MKSPTQPVTRELLWEILKSPETKRNILMFRKTGKAFYKTSLPGFTYQARFTESEKGGVKGCWRLQSNAVLTGLCMLDVDHVENPKAIIDGWLAKGEAWLKEQGVPSDVIIGAKNKSFVILEDEMKAVTKNVHTGISDLEAYKRAAQFYFAGLYVFFAGISIHYFS